MWLTDLPIGYLACLGLTLLALIVSVVMCWQLRSKLHKRKVNPTARFPMRPYRTFL
jgi:hypothetical protein